MRIPLKIKVHPVVREFIISTTGSDVIEPIKNSDFYHRVHFILQLSPSNYTEIYKKRRFKNEATITILVGRCNLIPEKHNPLCRNYLDDYRQHLISKELYSRFKRNFHNFMLGYMRGGGKQQKMGIEDFLTVYNIIGNEIKFEMLKKSWDRSEEKRLMTENLAHISSFKEICI